jgi:hypothetical protein
MFGVETRGLVRKYKEVSPHTPLASVSLRSFDDADGVRFAVPG